MNTDILRKIRKIRELRDYDEAYMARKLRITQGTYSKLESGAIKLTMERLEEIAKILEEPVENFLGNESPVYSIEHNHSEKFYGNIHHLHEENKEAMQQTISVLQSEVEHLQKENELLLKTIEAISRK